MTVHYSNQIKKTYYSKGRGDVKAAYGAMGASVPGAATSKTTMAEPVLADTGTHRLSEIGEAPELHLHSLPEFSGLTKRIIKVF